MEEVYLEAVRRRRQRQGRSVTISTSSHRKKRIRVMNPNSQEGRFNAFMHQNVEAPGWDLIPQEYAWLIYLGLFLFAPWLTGVAFFFFYVSNARPELFAQVHTGGVLLDWMIGYEILAALFLLMIGKNLLSYLSSDAYPSSLAR